MKWLIAFAVFCVFDFLAYTAVPPEVRKSDSIYRIVPGGGFAAYFKVQECK